MQISLRCREAKESEINFLVDAFRLTLIELLLKEKEIDILPTERTLAACKFLLEQSYARGYKSYIAECEDSILAYLVFVADNLTFDLNKNSCTILTLFVEPPYRYVGIANFLLQSVEPVLKARGIHQVNTHLVGVKHSPRLFKRWNHKRIETLQIFLDK